VEFLGFVHDQAHEKFWLVMERVEGGSLERFSAPDKFGTDGGQLKLDDKITVAIACWEGLDYLHTMRVCHKDIHPGNILVCIFEVKRAYLLQKDVVDSTNNYFGDNIQDEL